jgi:hypothetical protein
MRVREPHRSLQCDFYWGKVNEKTAISTIFLGVSTIFADFYLFLPIFLGFYGAPPPSTRPESCLSGQAKSCATGLAASMFLRQERDSKCPKAPNR